MRDARPKESVIEYWFIIYTNVIKHECAQGVFCAKQNNFFDLNKITCTDEIATNVSRVRILLKKVLSYRQLASLPFNGVE